MDNKYNDLQLTKSGRYYARIVGDIIEYYTLDKERIPLAKAQCSKCGDIIESKRCGHFVSCSCKSSFVDTDRWFPERHRYMGDVIIDND